MTTQALVRTTSVSSLREGKPHEDEPNAEQKPKYAASAPEASDSTASGESAAFILEGMRHTAPSALDASTNVSNVVLTARPELNDANGQSPKLSVTRADGSTTSILLSDQEIQVLPRDEPKGPPIQCDIKNGSVQQILATVQAKARHVQNSLAKAAKADGTAAAVMNRVEESVEEHMREFLGESELKPATPPSSALSSLRTTSPSLKAEPVAQVLPPPAPIPQMQMPQAPAPHVQLPQIQVPQTPQVPAPVQVHSQPLHSVHPVPHTLQPPVQPSLQPPFQPFQSQPHLVPSQPHAQPMPAPAQVPASAASRKTPVPAPLQIHSQPIHYVMPYDYLPSAPSTPVYAQYSSEGYQYVQAPQLVPFYGMVPGQTQYVGASQGMPMPTSFAPLASPVTPTNGYPSYFNAPYNSLPTPPAASTRELPGSLGGPASDGFQLLRSRKRMRAEPGEIMRCQQCGTDSTPEWRRGPRGFRTLCNACGLFHAKVVKKKGEEEADRLLRKRPMVFKQ